MSRFEIIEWIVVGIASDSLGWVELHLEDERFDRNRNETRVFFNDIRLFRFVPKLVELKTLSLKTIPHYL